MRWKTETKTSFRIIGRKYVLCMIADELLTFHQLTLYTLLVIDTITFKFLRSEDKPKTHQQGYKAYLDLLCFLKVKLATTVLLL